MAGSRCHSCSSKSQALPLHLRVDLLWKSPRSQWCSGLLLVNQSLLCQVLSFVIARGDVQTFDSQATRVLGGRSPEVYRLICIDFYLIRWEVLRKVGERAWSLMKFLQRKTLSTGVLLLLKFHHSRCYLAFTISSREQDDVSDGKDSIFAWGRHMLWNCY